MEDIRQALVLKIAEEAKVQVEIREKAIYLAQSSKHGIALPA